MTTQTTVAPVARGEYEVPGKWVVLVMFALGIAATATNYIYWEFHTRPFRPLTLAIGDAFPESVPKVEGGRHKGGPNTLRIAMRVPFDPIVDRAAADERVLAAFALIPKYAKVDEFERVELHEIYFAPQAKAISKSWRLSPADLRRAIETNQAPEAAETSEGPIVPSAAAAESATTPSTTTTSGTPANEVPAAAPAGDSVSPVAEPAPATP